MQILQIKCKAFDTIRSLPVLKELCIVVIEAEEFTNGWSCHSSGSEGLLFGGIF